MKEILGDGDKILNLHLKRLKKRLICICFRTIDYSLALGSYRKQVEKAKRAELIFRPRFLICYVIWWNCRFCKVLMRESNILRSFCFDMVYKFLN